MKLRLPTQTASVLMRFLGSANAVSAVSSSSVWRHKLACICCSMVLLLSLLFVSAPSYSFFAANAEANIDASSSASANSGAGATAPAWLAAPVDNGWQASGFLSPEDAFSFSYIVADTQTVILIWQIAKDYALYRDFFRFNMVNAPPGVLLANAFLPAGEWFDDPELGRVEIYTGLLEVPLLLNQPVKPEDQLELLVGFRGCARAGLCYPPSSQTVALSFTHAAAPAIEPPWQEPHPLAHNNPTTAPPPLWQLLLMSYLAGLGLAFTACVYPMIPIVTAVVCGPTIRSGSLKSGSLAAVYVLAMSCVYALAGVVAALIGVNLQASVQNAWVLLPVALLFFLLTLAAWGVFSLQLPGSVQSLLANFSQRWQGGSFRSAALMGALSALIVGPCTTPVLAGALTWIASGEDVIRGGVALWLLGLGIGSPLLLIGWGAGALLPKAGAWMQYVRVAMGALLLAITLHFLSRLLPTTATMWLVALWWLGVAVSLAVGNFTFPRKFNRRAVVILLCIILALFVAERAGQKATTLRQALYLSHPTQQEKLPQPFGAINSLADLEQARIEAQQQQRPFVLKVSANWCSDCRYIERTLFADPEIAALLAPLDLYELDISNITPMQRELLQQLQLFGPPALLFFTANGAEIPNSRLIGRFTTLQIQERLLP